VVIPNPITLTIDAKWELAAAFHKLQYAAFYIGTCRNFRVV